MVIVTMVIARPIATAGMCNALTVTSAVQSIVLTVIVDHTCRLIATVPAHIIALMEKFHIIAYVYVPALGQMIC